MKARQLVRALGCFVAVFGMWAAASAQVVFPPEGVAEVLQFPAQSPAIGHQTGVAEPDGTWFAQQGFGQPTNGFFSFGPYTTIKEPGDYVAAWSLKAYLECICNNASLGPDPAVANLDVNDANMQTVIASRQPLQGEFPGFGTNEEEATFGTFFLPFTLDSTRAGHQFEFRVFWFNTSSLTELNLGYVPLQWNAQNPSLGHQIGRADGGGWSASVTDPQGFMQYGPYTTLSNPGNYVALWTLAVDNNSANDNVVATLDINDATTQTEITSLQIGRLQFFEPFTDQVFQLPFTIDSKTVGHQFEFRIFYPHTSYVREQAVGVVFNQ